MLVFKGRATPPHPACRVFLPTLGSEEESLGQQWPLYLPAAYTGNELELPGCGVYLLLRYCSVQGDQPAKGEKGSNMKSVTVL